MATEIDYMQNASLDTSKNFGDYFALLKRNRSSIIATTLIFFAIILTIVLVWPPTYRSAATILIEEQEIPGDFVRSTITTFAVKRLQIISQRVMTRANLLDIIDRYKLYKDERRRETTEEIVERMREDSNLTTISADVVDPQTGRPTTATIAFSLSYDSRYPQLALKVTDELASLYLNENLKNRKEKAAEASEFLTEEANRLSEEISELERKQAEFKEKHSSALPEYKEHNFLLVQRLERSILETQNTLRALKDRRFYLHGQLLQINPGTPLYATTGERIMGPSDRLKTLQTEYTQLSNRYHYDHPDLVNMRREIESLSQNSATGSVDATSEKLKQLSRLRTELAANRKKYKSNHPEIIALEKSIESLQQSVKKSQSRKLDRKHFEESPENPAYITMKAQLNGVENDIAAYNRQLDQFRQKLEQTEQRMLQSPQVERQYLTLSRDHANAVHKFQEVKAKQMEAAISQELERDNKSERFSLIEAPALPEKPIKPNRIALIVLGIVLSIAIGFGQAVLREYSTGSVFSDRDVFLLLGALPLASIPFYENKSEVAVRERRKSLWILAVIILFIIALVLAHFFISPLDVLWYRILNRLEMLAM